MRACAITINLMLPGTKNMLRQFGWYEERQVPKTTITHWIDTLAKVGIQPFDAAIKVLNEFGGLNIQCRNIYGTRIFASKIIFDPLLAEDDRVKGWIEYLKQPAYPVGVVDDFMIIVAGDGKIYLNGQGWTSDGSGWVLGENIYEAVDALMLCKKLATTDAFWS